MSIFSKGGDFSKSLKSSPVPIKEVTGAYLPKHKLFNNWITLAGRPIYLYNPPQVTETAESKSAKDKLHNLIREITEKQEKLKEKNTNIEKINAQLKKEYLSALVGAYKSVLIEELKAGIVRIPCIYTAYDHTANVKSDYGSHTINYSPIITKVTLVKSIQETANHFALAVLESKSCGVITVVCKTSVSETSIPEFIRIFSEISDEGNSIEIEEFTHKKNNRKYQHRNDDDPSKF